jgi:CubicO group peptidase (beta-lactamase class C family)
VRIGGATSEIIVLTLWWLALTSPFAAVAQTSDSPGLRAHLDAAVRAFTPGHDFMGTVLVDAGGRRLMDKGYGLANVEDRATNAPGVKYRIGSLTKQFTAAAILLLQQDGRLSVDDPLARYLPDTPPAWARISLAELLGHTSGIPDLTRDPTFAAWSRRARTWPEVLARFRDEPLNFEPGGRFEYSSSNYELLGAVIERVSGKSYGEFLRDRIFKPLGMRDTGLDRDGLALSRRARGYVFQRDGALVRAVSSSMSVPWSAGGMYSTSDDLLRWEAGLFGGRLLSATTLSRMTTPGLGGYGMGVFVGDADGLRVIAHGGDIEGFHSFLIYVPQRRLTVVVLGNVEDPSPDRLARDLMSIALGHADVLPPISRRDLDRFAGTFDLAAAGFSLTFRRDGDVLESISDGQVIPTVYEGRSSGVSMFYVPRVDATITFPPNVSGTPTSMVLLQNGKETQGVRR